MICSGRERKSGAVPAGWGDAFGPYCLSRPSSTPDPHPLCAALLLMKPRLMAKGIIFFFFAAHMILGALRSGFPRFSGGTREKKTERN